MSVKRYPPFALVQSPLARLLTALPWTREAWQRIAAEGGPMSSGELESAIERRAVQAAEAQGWWQVKLMRCSKRGVPDRLFIRKGRVVFIEFKKPGETPSLQQQLRMAELRGQHVEVYWCDTAEDALDALA